MKRPDLYPEVFWSEGVEVVRSKEYEKAKEYIIQLEESLRAIAGVTKDGELPLIKVIHAISHKALK